MLVVTCGSQANLLSRTYFPGFHVSLKDCNPGEGGLPWFANGLHYQNSYVVFVPSKILIGVSFCSLQAVV